MDLQVQTSSTLRASRVAFVARPSALRPSPLALGRGADAHKTSKSSGVKYYRIVQCSPRPDHDKRLRMTDKFVDLHRWHDQLQQTCADQELVDKIMYCMEAESDEEAVRCLALILASEYRRQERYGEAEVILLDISDRDPSEPYPLIALAEQKLYDEQKLDEALEIVEKAVERARASRNFRRNALGVKARIAEKLQRYDLIADVLRKIMTIKFAESRVDVGIERDVFDRLPSGVIEPALLQQYDEFCRRNAIPAPMS